MPLEPMSDADIDVLKAKFEFLQQYSNSIIRNTRPENLVKLENAELKRQNAKKAKDGDDLLACNRNDLQTDNTVLSAGPDNRSSKLHQGRFYFGACCPTSRLWLHARTVQGLTGGPALANYDMASLGLGGMTTTKGWIELANPGSAKLSVRLFNINNCGLRVSGSSTKDNTPDVKDFIEVGEFQLALRTLRNAMHLVHPWNFSVVTLENFLMSNNYCHKYIGSLDNKAAILTRFTDYVLNENATRWRENEPFLQSVEMKATWSAFFKALPQSQLNRQAQKPQQQQAASTKQSGGAKKQAAASGGTRLPYLDICYRWNRGLCTKQAGSCTTKSGQPLRHICDHRTDPADLTKYCGLPHMRKDNH
jgi:hypothetical protein